MLRASARSGPAIILSSGSHFSFSDVLDNTRSGFGFEPIEIKLYAGSNFLFRLLFEFDLRASKDSGQLTMSAVDDTVRIVLHRFSNDSPHRIASSGVPFEFGSTSEGHKLYLSFSIQDQGFGFLVNYTVFSVEVESWTK